MKVYFLDEQFLNVTEKEQLTESFSQAGIEIVFVACNKSQEIVDVAGDADGILLMAVPVTREVIDALPKLRFIGRCGIGVDNVDIEASTERGIVVCNVPDHCTYEVASHAFALMMGLKRQLRRFVKRARQGGYAQGKEIRCTRIYGEVMGIIGYGKIGRELGKMALGMGMRVFVFDPFMKEISDEGVQLTEHMEEVLQKADVVSIHTPLLSETYHMIGERELKLMKKEAILINASRGPIIDTEALIKALKEGWISGAGLDVCEGEPLQPGHELLDMENVIFTPHVGMYSEQAMEDMYRKLAAQTIDVLQKRWTANIVNPAVREMIDF